MNEIIQKMNRLTIDSREVARMVEKRHADLLRDLNIFSNYLSDSIERKIALNEFWQESSYKDKIGRKLTCYLITKKGCEFIAHKMTGKKGAIFTATYINRFHAMEEALKHPKQKWLPPQILRCKYFNSVPCMTLADLEFVTGFLTMPRLYGRSSGITYPISCWLRRHSASIGMKIIYIPATAA